IRDLIVTGVQTCALPILFFNPIRPGSVASKERVLARATGKDLQFEVVSGKEAKTSGFVSEKTADDALFIRVHLPGPVPRGGQTRSEERRVGKECRSGGWE